MAASRIVIKNLGLALALLGWAWSCAPRLGLHRQNAEYRYDVARTFFYDLRREGDSLHVFLKLTDPAHYKAAAGKNLQFSYLVNLSYEKEEIVRRDSIPGFSRRLQVFPGYGYFHFKIPLAGLPLPAVLQMRVGAPAAGEEPWLDVPLTAESVAKSFVLMDSTQTLPLFRSYVHTREAFHCQVYPQAATVRAKQFPADFPAALPPFSSARKNVAPVLKPISSSEAGSEADLVLGQAGLYLLEVGTSRQGLVAQDPPFPDLTSARDLIEPLVYLTSAKEREALYKAENPKLALDRFWLQAANQDQARARRLIREYYGRVKAANQLFSAHKAGWQTDRGMIYIVFGKPDGVRRRQQGEEWGYARPQMAGPEIKFFFSKKPNTFTQNHYEVDRRLEYEFLWYSTVEKWRKGIILAD
ncbi:MAG: GWxTD domain-containing protein [Adhaeribacter sp.]